MQQTGTALARVKRDEHLQRTVRMVFSGQRFRRILDASLNAGGDDMTDFVKVRFIVERGVCMCMWVNGQAND